MCVFSGNVRVYGVPKHLMIKYFSKNVKKITFELWSIVIEISNFDYDWDCSPSTSADHCAGYLKFGKFYELQIGTSIRVVKEIT